MIRLHLGVLGSDTWHHVKLRPVQGKNALSGHYRLFWVQPSTGQRSTWWLDSNVKVTKETVRWEGRAIEEDPWGDNSSDWMPFQQLVNQSEGGVLFHQRGSSLQVRAKALQQDVSLGKIKFTPKYAELGRVVWKSDTVVNTPTAAFTYSISGPTVTLDASTSTAADNPLVSYQWSFGDGALGFGKKIKHTYSELSQNYAITLRVVDAVGANNTQIKQVGV